MSQDVRLAEVVFALEEAGVSCVVMGGHAVRFYGLLRYTNDVDLHVARPVARPTGPPGADELT